MSKRKKSSLPEPTPLPCSHCGEQPRKSNRAKYCAPCGRRLSTERSAATKRGTPYSDMWRESADYDPDELEKILEEADWLDPWSPLRPWEREPASDTVR